MTGSLDGYIDTTSSFLLGDVVFAPHASAVHPPVADSSDLPDFLANAGSTPMTQQSAGLPAGPLSPGSSHTAKFDWLSPDSFVDVYSYSSPVFVGTFPVVNGVVQITLSSEVLSKLGAGTHTLVVLGQSSGAVESVTYGIARTLASTGSDLGVAPFALAGLMLVAGVGVLVARRRALA